MISLSPATETHPSGGDSLTCDAWLFDPGLTPEVLAHIRELVDGAPPMTAAQRETVQVQLS